MCLLRHNSEGINVNVVRYQDVLSSELFEDGDTITKTSRSSQICGALIGGLALGGVGAIIGGLSGKKVNKDKVERIDLRLIVNDTKNPNHDLNFLDDETSKGGFIYKGAIKEARHWYGLIEVIIKQADQDDGKLAKEEPNIASNSNHIADELEKLAQLYKDNILTKEEFEQQKKKLLS